MVQKYPTKYYLRLDVTLLRKKKLIFQSFSYNVISKTEIGTYCIDIYEKCLNKK